MVNTFIDSALKNLDWLEQNCSLASPLKDQILNLKQKSRFLRTYLIYRQISESVPSASTSIFSTIDLEFAFRNATDELSSVIRLIPLDFAKVDSVVQYMLEKVELCEPEIRAILWEQPWKVNSPLIPIYSIDFIDSILENLDDLLDSEVLVPGMKKPVQILKEKLSFLRNLAGTILKRSIVHPEIGEFFSHVYVSATKAACLSYTCWDSQEDETMACKMEAKLSDLLQKIKPFTSDLMETFIGLVKASMLLGSETAERDEIEVTSFVNFIQENSLESLKDRIHSMSEELGYLIEFLVDLPDECSGDLEQISTDIKSVAEEAALFRVNDVKEEEIEEMNLDISRFLQKMKLIKAEIFLLQLIDSEEISMFLGKDDLRDLHEGLKFLRSLPIDLSDEKEEDGNLLPKHVQTLATEVTSIVYSIHSNKLTDDVAMKVKVELDLLLQKLKLIKLDLYLTELQNRSVSPVFPVKDQIANLHDGLLFLRTFLVDTKDIEAEIEDGKLFSAHLEYVVNESSLLISSCGVNEMTLDVANEMNFSIFRLLVLIKLIKAEVMLMDIMKLTELDLIVKVRDEVEMLQQGISFLKSFLMIPPKEEEELLVAKSEAIANEVESTIFSFHYQVRNEHMTLEINHLLFDLVDKIELLKAEIKDAYLQVPYLEWSNLPRLKGKQLNSSLLEDMNEMLNQEVKSLPFVRSRIEMLLGEFKSFESFIKDTKELYNANQELKDVWKCFSDVARQINYIIDLLWVGDDPVWYLMLWISFAMEDIKLIKAKVNEMYDEGMLDLGSHSIASAGPLEINDLLYGLDADIDRIVYLLTTGTVEIRFISIVGIGGVGKTTLAKSVYNNPSVVQHFTHRAWCNVSRQYDRQELLLEILRNFVAVSDSIYEMGADELEAELHNYLKHKRFLFILDDVWNFDALHDISRSFPDDNTRSRILLTTRFRQVAVGADFNAYIHRVNGLREQDSWELARSRISGGETLDLSLEEVLWKILRKCDGLPLAVCLVAGILANTERELSRWVHVERTLSSYRSSDRFLFSLEFAYACLPERLKPCFLCLEEFPEGKEIPARKLFQVWTVQGLIQQQNDSRTPEDVAEDYLSELISRSLVTLSKRRYNGKVRALQVHSLVRDLCMRKKEEMCTFNSNAAEAI